MGEKMDNTNVTVLETNHSNDIITFTNLGETMRNGIDPPKQLIPNLLYEKGIHSLYSPAGTGKTIIALWCAVQAMERGLHVIYCDEENGSDTIAELLQCYGADPNDVDTYLHYAEFPHLTSNEAIRWERTLQIVRPSFVAFDSFADMLALEGSDENSSVHVTSWIKHFAEPVRRLGGAVLILDHINRANSGRGARGSTAKLAKVDVAWKLEGKQFDRQTTAELTIKRDKDRMGCLPKKRTFIVGGDGKGNLIFDAGEVSNTSDPKELTEKEHYVLDILRDDFPNGAKAVEWKKATAKSIIAERTFYRVIKELEGTHIYKDEQDYYHLLS
jgi:hypothetical protein